MLARSKEQLRGDEREKGWLQGGPRGYGEAPTRSKAPKYPESQPIYSHRLRGFSWPEFYSKQKFFKKHPHTLFP